MIDGEKVGIVIKMREYVASLKRPTAPSKAMIIQVLESMIDFIEELQRIQWRNNELATGKKMGNYSPLTMKKYKKKSPKMNLYETGQLYDSVKAEVDTTLQSMFTISIDSLRYETNYVLLGKNKKIGIKEDGEPAFIGLSPAYTKIAQDEFNRRLRELINNQ